MAEMKRRYNSAGEEIGASVDADLTAGDIASSKAKARMSTTAGADLGGFAARMKAAKAAIKEEDESLLSPLMRASRASRKKRKAATTDDAAEALANR